MRYTLFSLSNEELNPDLKETQEEEEVLTAEDPIEKLEASFNKTADETAEKIESFENCSNCEEELEEQIEVIDEKIDNQPEEITEEVVEVAQEAFYNSLSKVLTAEELKQVKVQTSHESITLPVEKLMLAREDIADIIKTIVTKIKQAFQQVGQFFKKLWVKFVIFMDGTAKRANELYKKYNKEKLGSFTRTQFSESLLNEIKKKIGVLAGAKRSIYPSQLLPFIKYNTTPIEKISNDSVIYGDIFNGSVPLKKTIKIFQNQDALMCAAIGTYIESKFLKGNKNITSGVNNIISVIENEVKVVYFQKSENNSKEHEPDAYNDCVYDTITIDIDDFVKFNPFADMDIRKIIEDLKVIEIYAKGAGTYKDRLLDIQSSASKALDQISKDKGINRGKTYTKTELKYIQLLGSKMILDNIMQYVKNCKNLLWMSEKILEVMAVTTDD